MNNDKRGSLLVSLANCVTLTMILSVLSFIPFYTHQQELNQYEQPKAATATATATSDAFC
ncbi:hypothetical protein [Pseudomonas syringae]|uniref:hypothetical protein n=1 Tax=Pseudomonas syringae TaxID=317 RepID=UPI001E4473DF|nr:hypothetical protein [Pseudomonas syringae]